MPVQMIELEEVAMMDVSDDKLEEIVAKSKTQYNGVTWSMYGGPTC